MQQNPNHFHLLGRRVMGFTALHCYFTAKSRPVQRKKMAPQPLPFMGVLAFPIITIFQRSLERVIHRLQRFESAVFPQPARDTARQLVHLPPGGTSTRQTFIKTSLKLG